MHIWGVLKQQLFARNIYHIATIQWTHVSYSDTETQYKPDCIYSYMGLANI